MSFNACNYLEGDLLCRAFLSLRPGDLSAAQLRSHLYIGEDGGEIGCPVTHEVIWEELLLQYCPIDPHAPHCKPGSGKETTMTSACQCA